MSLTGWDCEMFLVSGGGNRESILFGQEFLSDCVYIPSDEPTIFIIRPQINHSVAIEVPFFL